jgi:hypothetical protein
MSYGNINKSTVYDVERMFEHFQNKYENIVSKDALRYPEITITSSSRTAPLPTTHCPNSGPHFTLHVYDVYERCILV